MKSTVKFPKIGQSLLRQFIPNIGSILIMAAMLFVYDARAASLATGLSPSVLSYQGTLTTASGTPVNGNVGMTFSLYNVQSGGTALWTEAHTEANAVPVNNGLFHVLLGSVTPIPSSVWENSSVYLGVQVEGDSAELSPREVVSAVPTSMATINLTIPDGSITSTKIADGAITSNKLSRQFNKVQLSTTYSLPNTWTWNDVLSTNVSVTQDTLVTVYGHVMCYYDKSAENYLCGAGVFVDGSQITQGDTTGYHGTSEGIELTYVLTLSPGTHTIVLKAMGSIVNTEVHNPTYLIVIQG